MAIEYEPEDYPYYMKLKWKVSEDRRILSGPGFSCETAAVKSLDVKAGEIYPRPLAIAICIILSILIPMAFFFFVAMTHEGSRTSGATYRTIQRIETGMPVLGLLILFGIVFFIFRLFKKSIPRRVSLRANLNGEWTDVLVVKCNDEIVDYWLNDFQELKQYIDEILWHEPEE